MKKVLGLAVVVLTLGMTAAMDAEARRLGGARSGGMQRQQITQPANKPNAPASPSQAAPAAGTAAAAGPAAAATAKRSWAGPLAGLAAGLGLAALASYLGFGEALASFMLIALIALAVLAVVGMVMRKRMAGATPAVTGAGAGAGGNFGRSAQPGRAFGGTRIGSALAGAPAAVPGAVAIPADFDAAAFARNAMTQFTELQSANDAGDLPRLRGYLTPEMFEVVRAEVESRAGVPQQTQVFGLQAQVVEVVEDSERYIVSVRFTGSVREQAADVPEDLDEIWHLTKPRTGFGGWVVAGIQQVVPDA